MKNLAIITVVLLSMMTISCKSNPDNIKEVSEADTIKKKIKTSHLYRIRSAEDELVSIKYFDEAGKLTKSTGFVGEGEIYHVYTYDDKGNQIKEVYTDSENKTFKEITTTTYEYKGNRIQKLVSMEDDGKDPAKKVMEETFEYNAQGQVSKKKSIGPYYTNEYEFSYFPNGEVKQKIDISDEGESKTILDYNEMGDVVKQELFSRASTSDEFTSDQINTWEFKGDTVYSETIKNGKVTYQKTAPKDKGLREEHTYYQ